MNYINDQLQASKDPALTNIVAVRDGAGIRFMNTQGFSVKLGTSTGAAGEGLSEMVNGSVKQGGIQLDSTTQGQSGLTDISNEASAKSAVAMLAAAVSTLGQAQAVVGRGQNQFSYAVNLAQSQLSNQAAAESRIRDADLASEAANMTKAQILLQAGVAAMAQANSAPQQILSLLRG
jgi:flagellin